MTTYGKSIQLSDGNLSVSGCLTSDEAEWKVKDLANFMGYKAPSRWRFWDQKIWVKK